MTRAEILRLLESDSSYRYQDLKDSVQPYPSPQQAAVAVQVIVELQPVNLAVWRLLLTLLEAE